MFLSLLSRALQLQRRRRRRKNPRSGASLHQFGHQNMQNVHKLTEKVLRPKLYHEVVCSSGIAREKDGIVPWGDPLPSFLTSCKDTSPRATTTTRIEGEALDDPQSSIVGKLYTVAVYGSSRWGPKSAMKNLKPGPKMRVSTWIET
jgi:hypothetical protein